MIEKFKQLKASVGVLAYIENLTVLCSTMQNFIEQEDGGLAGMVFSTDDLDDWELYSVSHRTGLIEQYLELEKHHALSESKH